MSKNPEAKVKQQSVTAFFSKKPSKTPVETSTQVTRSPSIFAKFINVANVDDNKRAIFIDSEEDISPVKPGVKPPAKSSDEVLYEIKENLANLNRSISGVDVEISEPQPKPGGAFKFRQSSKALNFSGTSASSSSASSVSNPPNTQKSIESIVQSIVAQPEPCSNQSTSQLSSSTLNFELKYCESDGEDDFSSIGAQKSISRPKDLLPRAKSKPSKIATQSIESAFNEERQKSIKGLTKKPETKHKVDVPGDSVVINLDESLNSTSNSISNAQFDSSRLEPDLPSKTSTFKHRTPGSTQASSTLQNCLEALEKNFMEVDSPKKTSIRPVSSVLSQLKEPEFNQSSCAVIGQTQLSPVKEISITIDPNLLNEIDKATKDPTLNTCSVQRLKDEKLKFLEAYYNIMTQIPMTFFEPIQGFSQTAALKVKMAIESISGRIKRIEKSQMPPPPPMNVSSPFEEDYSMINDDQVDFNELMQNVSESRLAEAGKFHTSYVDLSNIPSPASSMSTFKPRVNMAMQSIHGNPMLMRPSPQPQIANNTDFVDSFEIDDDGFPNIDFSQLVDVLPTSSTNTTASSTQSKKSQPTEKRVKETVDSLIPEASGSTIISPSDDIGKFHSNVQNDGITGEFNGFDFSFSVELKISFKSVFGLREFRSNQLQAINAVLLGHDCFILMPTGGGKSLCYQLPAVISHGVTIVVSPLKSLILDQVNKLKSLDIEAATLSGEVSADEVSRIYADLRSFEPKIKLLYVTPEKICASATFQSILDSMHNKATLARIVIDEAHCVSAWGHDFRPDYKKLGELRKRYPKVPVMALTATATPRVRVDVVHQLGIQGCKWFLCSFNRPNLKYIVAQKNGSKTLNDVILLIKTKFPRVSGIIYCIKRKDCDAMAEKLQLAEIKAISYHAGMNDKEREKAQRDWITDKYRVVCATIAFGMGIDKPDVRYVIHYSLPKSIEGYYQESGRAGRDGAIATCILYYNYGDKSIYISMFQGQSAGQRQVSMNNLDLIVNFCENKVDCRRALQLDYFGEYFTRDQCLMNETSACDNCSRKTQYQEVDATETCKMCLNAVNDLGDCRRFTVLQMVELFKGANTKKIIDSQMNITKYHGHLKTWDRGDIQRIFTKLIIETYLKEEIVFIRDIPQTYVKVGPRCAQLMNPGATTKIMFPMTEVKQKAKKVEVTESEEKDNELSDECYHALLDVVKDICDEKGLTIQQVFNMQALAEMSKRMPETKNEMMQIPHVTTANFDKFGKRLLEVTSKFSAERMMNAMDKQEEEESNVGSYEDDGSNWDDLGRAATTSTQGSSGKRKFPGSWGNRGAKRYRGNTSRGKKKTGGSTARGGSKANLLPRPRPQF